MEYQITMERYKITIKRYHGDEGGDICAYIESVESSVDHGNIECSTNPICNKQFHLTLLESMEPFIWRDEMNHNLTNIEDVLHKCCGSCVNVNTDNTLTDLGELTFNEINNSHFIYPILATAGTTRLHGMYYLPCMDAPGVMYVTVRTTGGLFTSLAQLYPLLVVAILLAVV